MRTPFTLILVVQSTITLISCSNQENTNDVREAPKQVQQNGSLPTTGSVNNSNASAKKQISATSPVQTAPKAASNSHRARASASDCPESKIPLCQKLARSSGPPFGSGGALEGMEMEDGLKIIKECYELKQKGCF